MFIDQVSVFLGVSPLFWVRRGTLEVLPYSKSPGRTGYRPELHDSLSFV